MINFHVKMALFKFSHNDFTFKTFCGGPQKCDFNPFFKRFCSFSKRLFTILSTYIRLLNIILPKVDCALIEVIYKARPDVGGLRF